MKIKYSIIYAAVAVAFAAVSAWVFLSGGRSAKAIRTKFRLGGLLLTVGGMLGAVSCGGGSPFVTCYDVMMPEECTFKYPDESSNAVRPGDAVVVSVRSQTYSKYRYELLASEGGEMIQKDALVFDKSNLASVIIADTTFKGGAWLYVYGLDGNDEYMISGSYLEIQ